MQRDLKRVAQSTSELRLFIQTHTHRRQMEEGLHLSYECDTLKYKFGTLFDLYLIFWVHC